MPAVRSVVLDTVYFGIWSREEFCILPEALSLYIAKPRHVANIKKVETEIRALEGFDVVIRQGKDRSARSEKLTSYAPQYDRAARNRFTVADWKRARFEPNYPGFDVDVLRADGRPATPKTLLQKLRAEYD
jgi:hypothetical protein